MNRVVERWVFRSLETESLLQSPCEELPRDVGTSQSISGIHDQELRPGGYVRVASWFHVNMKSIFFQRTAVSN